MRSTFQRVRRVIHRITVGVVVLQFAAMVALTLVEALRKKKRKTRTFPVTRSAPIPVNDDKVTIYTYGEDTFAAMLDAIEQARDHIYFETFIWKNDETGTRFRVALGRAAERGVRVYAVWDGFANLVVPRSFFRALCPKIHTYRLPAVPVPWNPRRWGRDHRKLIVVDDRVGFIGGYNIGSLYATGWRDTHARITGPAVADLANAFVDFWNMQSPGHRIESPSPRSWGGALQVHRNTPRIQVYPIRNMYLEAIDRASSHIWLTHAYLIPDDDLVSALRDAVNRGVDVRIIVPAVSNHVVADWLSRSYYDRLLQSGIRLFLYQGAMVHAKTGTIDGHWSTIGTANLDRLSLLGNYEINLEILDPAVAHRLEEVFAVDQSNAIELTEDRWRERSWVAKATETLLSPWRPLF